MNSVTNLINSSANNNAQVINANCQKVQGWAADLLNQLEQAYTEREFGNENHPNQRVIQARLEQARTDILRALVTVEIIGPEIEKAQRLLDMETDWENSNLYRVGFTLSLINSAVLQAKRGTR